MCLTHSLTVITVYLTALYSKFKIGCIFHKYMFLVSDIEGMALQKSRGILIMLRRDLLFKKIKIQLPIQIICIQSLKGIIF